MRNLSASVTDVQRATELRVHLLDVVNAQKGNIAQLAQRLRASELSTPGNHLSAAQSLLQTLDTVLEAGDWDSSLFLRNTIKPVRLLREEAQNVIERLTGGAKGEDIQTMLAPEQVTVYITLFQNQGYDLRRWEMQLRALSKSSLGRPVYAEEEQAQRVTSMSSNQASQAYAIVAVTQTAVQANTTRADRYGNSLLSIKDGAIMGANIMEFVHNDKRYRFKNNKLVQLG